MQCKQNKTDFESSCDFLNFKSFFLRETSELDEDKAD